LFKLIKRMKEREDLKQVNFNSSENKTTNSSSEIMLKKFENNFESFNNPDLWLNADLRQLLDSTNKPTKSNFVSATNNIIKKTLKSVRLFLSLTLNLNEYPI
jgi:hypothetical protein